MDQVLFLAQGHIESAQVKLYSLSGRVSSSLSSVKKEAKNIIIKSFCSRSKSFIERYHEIVQSIHDGWLAFRSLNLYDRCVYFLLTEITHTHIYFGGICFILGALIGIGLGSRNRDGVIAPKKMRAVVANGCRGLESICLVESILVQRITHPHHVLVCVKAAGVDLLDIKIAEGHWHSRHSELPIILGRDGSGVVVAIGREVTKVEPGDEVWFAVPVEHQGTLSEYLVVSANCVALKPLNLTHEGAAVLPYNIMKASDALLNQGLDEFSTVGKRFLIHSGTSGLGLVAVQLAKAWGGHVTAITNSAAVSLVERLGADHVIMSDVATFEEVLKREKYDVMLNTVGVSNGGIIVSTDPSGQSDAYGIFFRFFYEVLIRIKWAFKRTQWVTGCKLEGVNICGDVLDRVAPLIASGQMQPVIDKVYSAQDAELAFHHISTKETVGKIAISFRMKPLASIHPDCICLHSR